MHLYLIRHGQSHVNLKDWDNGNTDEGLTDLGHRQAAALARWIVGEIRRVDLLVASTLQRTRETARYLADAYGCGIHYSDWLREIGNCRLDHTPWPNHDLPRDYADYWSSERPFASITPAVEGGESYMHFRTRVGLAIEELVSKYPKKTILVVCHGGVIEAVFDHAFNVGPWRRCEMFSYNTAVTHFEHVNHPLRETWRLHYHNAIQHLKLMDVGVGIEKWRLDSEQESETAEADGPLQPE
jgi:broad specificity phosphatase PhoE